MHSEKASKIFNKIAVRGPEFVSSSLGEVGKRLAFMFENFGNHPETDSFFFEDRDLSICDLLDIAEYAEKKGIGFFSNHLASIADVQASETLKNSKMPSKNGYRARFLRGPKRDLARSSRRIQQICSRSFVQSTLILWEDIQGDFSLFAKGVPFSGESRESFVFKEMGCRNLESAARGFHERFRNPPCVLGYKKLGVIDAARIAAKANGCLPDESGGAILSEGGERYCPLIVPLFPVGNAPDHVKNAVDDAEHCKDLFFDSVFDNYVVLIPFFEDLSGSQISPRSRLFSLDSGTGCVLGERDGEFYFVVGFI